MSPFMTVEVLMTESDYRDGRTHRSYEEPNTRPAIREPRGRGSSRTRGWLRTLLRNFTLALRSV